MPKARKILIAEDEKAISKALRDKLVKSDWQLDDIVKKVKDILK
jgi:hypothetical protein